MASPFGTPMPTVDRPTPVPRLEPGDRLSRDEFERRWDAMPGLRRAELIEGVVHVPSPVRHGVHDQPVTHLIHWLCTYQRATPGVQSGGSPSIRLDNDNEPQPDAYLRLEHGGQTRVSSDDYLEGAPELVVEVAASSVSRDLHDKLHVYRRSGVREYLVVRSQDRAVDWFRLVAGRYEPLPRGPDGTLHSRVFPGLWLDPQALLDLDLPRLLGALERGLASPEHAAFLAGPRPS